MVVPYGDGDEAVRAVDLIESDPAAADVSVVVLDLSHAFIDAATGAQTLERVIAAAEAYGADTIFAAVSEAAKPVVEDLGRQPLIVTQELDTAVATAFQVADAQRMIV
jgi:anti-anti-sigma regulatory factor